ncbi:hypothetical protein PC123_g11366 [Phytophthora cactorum]|nr:hypothetical protein PC123_g11366 [Phytophthora cactorum]
MELPDPKYLVSHVGHDMQRFDKKRWSRLLSSAVVMRTNEQGQHQIVFLSSSNPKKGDFLLPKGGWDKGEDIKKAALREVIEEGGVNAQLAHGLGKVKFEDAGKKYTYFAYLMKANKIYDDWAESIRYRLWVSLDEAEVMLARRGQKVKVVKRAMAVNPFVDTHLGDCAKRFDEVVSAPAKYVPNNVTFAFSFYGNPGVVQIGDRHQHAVDRASHTAEATAADAGLAACRRDDAGAEAGAVRAHAQSLVAGEHSNAGGAAIAHAGRGGEGDDRIVGGADFGPGKTTTSSSNTKLVAALVRSKGLAARGGSVEVNSDGGGADSIDAGAPRDRDQDAAAVQHSINELDSRGAGVGHQRTADRDAYVAATCGSDVEVIGGEDDVDDPATEAVRGRGQVASARRQEHGNAGVVRIVRGEDGGENSDEGSGQQRASTRRARPDDVADTSSQQDSGHTAHNIETPVAVINATRSTTPRNRTPYTPTIEQLYYKKMVTFSPSKELWMKDKIYSQFQNAVEAITVAAVQRGIENYQALVNAPNQPAWRDLTDKVMEGGLNLDLPLDELEVASDEDAYESV